MKHVSKRDGRCVWEIHRHPSYVMPLLFLFTGINQCDILPCLHDGKCVDLEIGSGSGFGSAEEIDAYKCVCPAGYTGRLCERGKVLRLVD